MKNLKLKYKFIIITLLAALPTAVATYLLVKQSSISIDFAAKEISGSDYLQPVRDIHELLAEYRLAYMSSLVDGDNQRPAIRERMTNLITDMSAKHQALGAKVGVEGEWDEAKASITTLLETEPGQGYDTAKDMHDATYAKLNALITRVGDGCFKHQTFSICEPLVLYWRRW